MEWLTPTQASVTAERWRSRCATNPWSGLLPLRRLSALFSRAGKRVYVVEKENVNITKGAEFLGRHKSSDISDRRYCTKCGGHIMVDHPEFSFKPKVHLNYQETVFPMRDGLLKLRDFPSAIGGTGETLPE